MQCSDLRAWLHQLNLTQVEFAAMLGTTKRTVGRWVRGEVPVPPYVASYVALYDAKEEVE